MLDQSIHLDLDGAWLGASLPIRSLDFRDWGPKLRYFASGAAISKFDALLPKSMPPYVLYGSGDFHHLSALWLRRAVAAANDVVLISFDNHPDWDIRPPRWSCGGWINRSLDLPAVRHAQVWGCGNFELKFPSRLFANRQALRSGRLFVHPWAERQDQNVRRHFDCMTRDNWRYRFERFAATLVGVNVYITVDLDCLTAAHARTNWEDGLFTAQDIAWAIAQIRSRAIVIGGDVCGAYSPVNCQGILRRLAVWWDHPKLAAITLDEARQINSLALTTIWPALAGEN